MEKLLGNRLASVTVTCLLTLGLVAACSPSLTSPSPSDRLVPTSLAPGTSAVTTGFEGGYSASYGKCPTAEQACGIYHPGSEPTAYCSFQQCFEMNYGSEARVVAADEQGSFPRTLFVWHKGEMSPIAELIPCVMTQSGHKTRLDILDGEIKCAAALSTSEHLYYEHFASNPATGCLGWVECRAY